MAYEIDWEKGVVDAPAQPAAAEPDLSFLEQYEAQQPPAVPPAPSAAARPSIGAGYETTDWEVTPEQLVEQLHHGQLRPEPLEDGPQFQANHAAADHREGLGHAVEVEGAFVGQDVLAEREER